MTTPFVGKKMPPLNPMRAFEAAARHLSFTKAAEELCVTQGAISRSVRTLEEYLGESLFERKGTGLTLTVRSEAFANGLTDGFSRLSEAAEMFLGVTSSPVLTIRAYTSFMVGFLIPNLPDFQIRHPEIKIRLLSITDRTDLAGDHFDVRIRYGRGQWKYVSSTLLFRDQLRPVCSPVLLDPAKRPYPLEIIRELPILHQAMRRGDWADWLARVKGSDIRPRHEIVFDETSLVYQGALNGSGIIMAQNAFFRREIAEGRLFEPFDGTLTRDLGYYMTTPVNRKGDRHVRAFRHWLVEAIAKTGLGEADNIIVSNMRQIRSSA